MDRLAIEMRVLNVGCPWAVDYLAKKGLASEAKLLDIDVQTATEEVLQASMSGAEMVFIVADLCHEQQADIALKLAMFARLAGILSVGVVATAHGSERHALKNDTIKKLLQQVDALLIGKISNTLSFCQMLYQAVLTVTTAINTRWVEGCTALDFADVRYALNQSGLAKIGHGAAQGDDCEKFAIDEAVKCHTLGAECLIKAQAVIVSVFVPLHITMAQYGAVMMAIKPRLAEECIVFFAWAQDAHLTDGVEVLILAAGVEAEYCNRLVGSKSAKKEELPDTPTQVNALDIPIFLR